MLYTGMIQKVIPPNDPTNFNKFQYEYLVLVKGPNFAQMPLNHVIVSEEFGSVDDYNDRTFKVGMRVYVQCPNNDMTSAVIVGAIRNTPIKTDPLLGHHWRRRFNQIEQHIDKDYGYNLYVKPDASQAAIGPAFHLNPKFIILNDQQGEKITFDVEKKTLTIDTNELVINVVKNATINVKENATVNVEKNLAANVKGDAAVTVQGNLSAKVTKNLNAECDKLTAKAKSDATVEAGGTATVKGSSVVLNKKMTGITTAQSHQNVIDLITGVPVIPSQTVYGDV